MDAEVAVATERAEDERSRRRLADTAASRLKDNLNQTRKEETTRAPKRTQTSSPWN